MKHAKLYNLFVFAAALMLAALFIPARSNGRVPLVTVDGCEKCDGKLTFPPQNAVDLRVRHAIQRMGLDPEAFTLAKAVAGDFWISGSNICTLDSNGMNLRCHPHF